MFSKNKNKKWKISCTLIISDIKNLNFLNKKNIQLLEMNILEEFEPTAPPYPKRKKFFNFFLKSSS